MKYIYEFIGAFFLVFTVGMTVINTGTSSIMAPIAIGSILAVMVYAGGHISGGHYNPAVSFAAFVRGALSLTDMIIYWIAQLLGGIFAAYLTLYFKGETPSNPLQMDVVKSLIAEFLFTFALCYVVLNVATAIATKGNSYFGFAIGFTVLAGAYAVGTISGAAFNPAVALGITIMNLSTWANLWVFLVANLLGGAVAGIIFKLAHPVE